MSYNISCVNCSSTFLEKYKNFFKKNMVKKIDSFEKILIDKIQNSPLYSEYVKIKYVYDNGGLLLDGNFEFVSSIDNLLENDLFFVYQTENLLSSKIVWSKHPKNNILKKILHTIEQNLFFTYTQCVSEAINIDISSKYNSIIKIDDNSYIYPYDYFFPIDYEKCGKNFSENTVAIFIENKKISLKNKIKKYIFNSRGPATLHYMLNLAESLKFRIVNKRNIINKKIHRIFGKNNVDYAIKKIKNINSNDYIVFHHPNWLGVSAASEELFDNLVPLKEIYNLNNVKKLINIIKIKNIKQIIFSSFVDGWELFARQLKKEIPNISLKSFWHGSHSQVIEDINWRTNLSVINLHKEGIIDVMGTCKESLLNFYKAQGYKAHFIKNTVRLDEKYIDSINKKDNKNKELRIGIYAAGMGWRKNMFTQLAAASMFDGAVIDSVPLTFDAQVFVSKLDNKIEGVTNSIKRKDMLNRLSNNDINLYVTFSECAPMLPIESMEVGTLCLTGNNHHYFKNTELEKYLIVDREDDIISIFEKMKYALENKDKIFNLYKKWKKDYDLESEISVQQFLDM